ncbi:N-acetylmuramoyl-L-alanine amidase [Vibrio phage 033B]|nr:N-acetylmuramoyl-L-alanine amidase [Vibrio phage 033B]
MKPQFITVHCSASKTGRYLTASEIRTMHTRPKSQGGNGWSDIGYHAVIRTDGAVEMGRPLTRMGAGVGGHNQNNLHVCLVGGVDSRGRSVDNYTAAQKNALFGLILDWQEQFNIPNEGVKGHRDWFGDTNGDGVIDSRDWYKDCPCFDVVIWFESQLRELGRL